MLSLLKKHFGYEQFRPLQGEIIDHIVAGKDALVLMPTGGGKSLCYQLPALRFEGITIVISPLIALMKDQVDALRANGIAAAFMNSTVPPAEMERIEMWAERGGLKLLYLAPERVAMPHVQRFLQKLKVSLIAIDEAHCISEWGHDFRPDYRNLKLFRHLFPKTPIMALTATANPRVRDDIVKQLGLENGRIFQSSFNRPNLVYRVQKKQRAFDELVQEIKARPSQAIIIYCFSRKGTEKTVADLEANGIHAAAYHAGLSAAERNRVQDGFIRDQVSVIAATIAFGMGIDKPDVRLVVHMDLPKSVEGYYQETGRAGRDGLSSDCLLFYSGGDRFKHEFFIREMADLQEQRRARMQLDNMVKYCEQTVCRRKFLLAYFGEAYTEDHCNACDICLPPREKRKAQQAAVEEFDQALFEILRGLRRVLADSRGVPPYIIFGDRTLQEMARYYPQRQETLAQIFGVGKEKLAQYGARFLEEICAYARERSLTERPIPSTARATQKAAPVRAVSDTMAMTIQLFAEKKSLEEIARLRDVSLGTVFSHLEKAQQQGTKLDSSHLAFPSRERYQTIVVAFQKCGNDFLAPARAILGDSYTYDEIRLARFLMKTQSMQ